MKKLELFKWKKNLLTPTICKSFFMFYKNIYVFERFPVDLILLLTSHHYPRIVSQKFTEVDFTGVLHVDSGYRKLRLFYLSFYFC